LTKQGTFIGLMQVPVTAATAWNWTINVAKGAQGFSTKPKTAQHYQKNQLAADTPLPQALAATQIVDIETELYKALGNRWYWVPQCSSNINLKRGNCSGGSWQWVPNPNPCKNGGTICDDSENVLVQVNKVKTTSAPCEQ
jgi:hypothetical protein